MAFVALGQGGAKSAAPVKSSSKVAFILLAPGMIYLGLFFLTPLVSLVITSLKTASMTGVIGMYDYGFEPGFRAMQAVLARQAPVTAMICGNDYLAAGALSEATSVRTAITAFAAAAAVASLAYISATRSLRKQLLRQ